ncbi:hypothetical protein [Pedobacter sp. SYSU D00535]|uniref:hypothetical protein n=1 Tax=Pedobacter sp. SYSU D00535 TaxID=2810308 RepID=UPI001A967CB5|nr:hypothetical protein [Pedobacter sp. SYSU D00535]
MTAAVLTTDSVKNALAQLSDWFPEHSEAIDEYHDDLVHHIVKGTKPDDETLNELTVGEVSGANIAQANVAAAAAAHLSATGASHAAAIEFFTIKDIFTPCNLSIGTALLNVGLFVLGLVGLKATANTNVTRALLTEMGAAPLNNFLSMFRNFSNATGAWDRAKTLFSIAGSMYKACGFKAIFKAWVDEASWFDWVRTGAIAIAQLIAWFATDGVAFVAQVAMTIMSAEMLIESIVKAISTCSAGDCPVPHNDATTKFIPAGSYLYTASDVAVTLKASCKNLTNQKVDSSLDVSGLSTKALIKNKNGVLQFDGLGTQFSNSYAPLGSYTLSCEGIKVVLSANCKNISGDTVKSTLDITDLPAGKTISNINGVLTIDK